MSHSFALDVRGLGFATRRAVSRRLPARFLPGASRGRWGVSKRSQVGGRRRRSRARAPDPDTLPVGYKEPLFLPGDLEGRDDLEGFQEAAGWVARDWLRDALLRIDDKLSDAELETVEAALGLLDIDLRQVISERTARLRRVQPFFLRLHRNLVGAGGTESQFCQALPRILDAVQVAPVDVLRPVADAISLAGRRRSRLHTLLRHVEAQARGLRRDPVARFEREVRSKLDLLKRFDALAKRLGLRELRTMPKRPAFGSVPVQRLVDVFRGAGYSDYRAFKETAKFLQAWDPTAYGVLTPAHVRSRWRSRLKSEVR